MGDGVCPLRHTANGHSAICLPRIRLHPRTRHRQPAGQWAECPVRPAHTGRARHGPGGPNQARAGRRDGQPSLSRRATRPRLRQRPMLECRRALGSPERRSRSLGATGTLARVPLLQSLADLSITQCDPRTPYWPRLCCAPRGARRQSRANAISNTATHACPARVMTNTSWQMAGHRTSRTCPCRVECWPRGAASLSTPYPPSPLFFGLAVNARFSGVAASCCGCHRWAAPWSTRPLVHLLISPGAPRRAAASWSKPAHCRASHMGRWLQSQAWDP